MFFLFVALSLPIIKSIYLLKLDGHAVSDVPATSIGTELRFGVWGFCVTRFASPILLPLPVSTVLQPKCVMYRHVSRERKLTYHSSALNKPTLLTNTGLCIGPQLGYTIDPIFIKTVTNEPDLANLVLKGITVLLVLHPIAAGLAFLTLLPVIASCCVYHAAPWIISLVLSVATAIVSTVVFAADVALVIVARHKLKQDSTLNVTLSFGNGVWLVLVGMIFTWIAMILLSARICGCCGLGR
jgi:hypothetical protein